MKINRGYFFLLLLTITLSGFSQDNGLGIRVMNLIDVSGVGVSIKYSIHGRMSYEATVGSSVNMDLAFVKTDFNFVQRPVGIQGLDWYSGVGVQSWFSDDEFDIAPELTLGLDWDLVSLPLGLFIDGSFYIPLIDNNPLQSYWQLSAGLRVLFK
jgi:hypothetical protein